MLLVFSIVTVLFLCIIILPHLSKSVVVGISKLPILAVLTKELELELVSSEIILSSPKYDFIAKLEPGSVLNLYIIDIALGL